MDTKQFLFLLFPFLVIGVYFLSKLLKSLSRKKIIQTETPTSWVKILNENLQIYHYLPEKLKTELIGLIKVFISEKNFHGCQIQITEEIQVTIAAQACILLLNKKHDYYPNLKNIFIYPNAFKSIQKEHEGYIQKHKSIIRSGESWVKGPVVLSWQHSLHGAKNKNDGQNVVIHEFAHQLDQEDNHSDGVPELPNSMSYKTWASVMSKNFKKLTDDITKNKKTLLDEYGATNSAEFFAVLTETFFEKPKQLFNENEDLYLLMKKYYALDPLAWLQE